MTTSVTSNFMRLKAAVWALVALERLLGLFNLGVFIWFYVAVLRLYRRALAGAALSDATRVFDGPMEPVVTGPIVS